MPRRSKRGEISELLPQLLEGLEHFAIGREPADLRTNVRNLVNPNYLLRDIGSSLVADPGTNSGRSRILWYLRQFVGEVISSDELMVVSGIHDYPRRARELRVQEGWPLITGVTIREMREDASQEDQEELSDIPDMKPDDYLLLRDEQDIEAAHRWKTTNAIRGRKNLSVRDRILEYMRANVGAPLTSEELRYVAGDKSEWARRTRELRTEYGWPVVTKTSGRPDLPVGVYVLENDRQAPEHDRKIKDDVRRKVLRRDDYTCQYEGCGWHHDLWNRSDPRHLEVHHLEHHAKGGSNEAENLITYCNVCHDVVHRVSST